MSQSLPISKKEFENFSKLAKHFQEMSLDFRERFEKHCNLSETIYDYDEVEGVSVLELFETFPNHFTYDDVKEVFRVYGGKP